MKIYIIMCLNDIIGDTYYTDEEVVSKRVESIKEVAGNGDFWYKTLTGNKE